MSNPIHINLNTISKNMLGNEQMMKNFVGMYLQHCHTDFEKLREAVLAENHEEISAKAHHIKPTMAYIGASALGQQFQDLETAGEEKDAITSITEKFHLLDSDFAEMLEELKSLYDSLS